MYNTLLDTFNASGLRGQVKGFVHAVDTNHNDRVTEEEVLQINYYANLSLSEEVVAMMFDEVTGALGAEGADFC